MRKLIIVLACVVVLLFVATQLFVPPLLEARVGEGLAPLANGAPVHVELASFPAYRMLVGSVSRFDVSLENFFVDGLPVERFQLQARNVDVDVARLLRGETLPLRRAERLNVEAVITEDGLGRYVNEQMGLPGPVATSLSADGLRLSGEVALLNNVVPVVVTGTFQPTGGPEVLFVPDDVVVQGTPLPAFMVTVLRETYTMRIDLGDAPLPLFVDEVVHEAGRLVVRGRPQTMSDAAPASTGPTPAAERPL